MKIKKGLVGKRYLLEFWRIKNNFLWIIGFLFIEENIFLKLRYKYF